MLTRDVTVGAALFTRVGGELVAVQVVTSRDAAFGGKGKRFVVRRVDSGAVLPKARTAAALHRTRDPLGERAAAEVAPPTLAQPWEGHEPSIGVATGARGMDE